MADRPERPNARDKVQVTPDPKRPDLFNFLTQHFTAQERPQFIELKQAYGPGLRKYGVQVTQKEFKATAPNQTREQLVAMSNEFLAAAQGNCNGIGKPHKYGLLLRNPGKGDQPYAIYVISCRPDQDVEYDPNAVDDDEDFHESGIVIDAKRRDNLLQYSLEHLKHGDEHERYRQDQFSQAMGDIIGKYQALATSAMNHNLELQREHRELVKITDDALSRKHERELAAKMQEFKIGMMGDAFTFLKQMAPVVVNQIQGKQVIPTKESTESLGIMSFLQGLTQAQGEALFGKYDENKNLMPGGIFTPEQSRIFAHVAQCLEPPEMLDQLLGGEHAVTEAQVAAAQSVVSQQQFLPLIAMVMTRRKQPTATATTTAPAAPAS